MAKRRPRPDEPESKELAAMGRMLQDAFACAKGERPETLNDRTFGFGFRLSLGSIILADFVRPYLGLNKTFGPLNVQIPGDFGWKQQGAALVFHKPLIAKFRRFAALEIEVYKLILSGAGVTVGLRWTPLGMTVVDKEVHFPFDFTSPN